MITCNVKKHTTPLQIALGITYQVGLRKAAGQEYVVLPLDQQLYRVALDFLWDDTMIVVVCQNKQKCIDCTCFS